MTGENGGGAFVLIYIASVLIIALPIMIAEVFIGRHGKQNPVASLKYVANESSSFDFLEVDRSLNRVRSKRQSYSNHDDYSNWQLVGWAGIIAGILILSFYSVIAGWTISYIFKAATGAFISITSEQSQSLFDSFISDPRKLLAWHTMFMIFTCYIVAQGVKGGLEKAVKFFIPALFFLLIGLAIYSITLPGFYDGISYMFIPDITKINSHVILLSLIHI